MPKKDTSWGKVADWYNDLLSRSDTYQKEVILPNLIRLMDIKKGESVLDLACGQGFFSREFARNGAKVVGVDIGKELIDIARKASPEISFHVSPANSLKPIKNDSVDKISIVLALQNIEDLSGVFSECFRVLKSKGKLFFVLNHPSFRIPKYSRWEWDEKRGIQYRRLEEYISESRVSIEMNPGQKNSKSTISFHRPLQSYFKMLTKNGFVVTHLEEWVSHKESEKGPRQSAENRARNEFPMFLTIEAHKG